MIKRIVWSETAVDDLEDIVRYIKTNSGKEIANSVYKRIVTRIEKISSFPESGRLVTELTILGNREIHETIESPWRIFFRIDVEKIFVITVIDGRRNDGEILFKKMIDAH